MPTRIALLWSVVRPMKKLLMRIDHQALFLWWARSVHFSVVLPFFTGYSGSPCVLSVGCSMSGRRRRQSSSLLKIIFLLSSWEEAEFILWK